MAVSIIASETLDGAQVSDSIQGGGSGADLGQVGTGSYSPLTNKTSNQGHFDLFVRHDGLLPIYGVTTFIQPMGEGTPYSYGGGNSAAGDFASMKSMGNVSGNSKNNADGMSGGLWVDMDWDAGDATRFDQANFPSFVKIYGDNNTDGISLNSGFPVIKEAMVYGVAGVETQPSAPVDGKIGAQGSPLVLGDNAHLKLRQYLRSDFASNGYFQFEYVIAYSYDG